MKAVKSLLTPDLMTSQEKPRTFDSTKPKMEYQPEPQYYDQLDMRGAKAKFTRVKS